MTDRQGEWQLPPLQSLALVPRALGVAVSCLADHALCSESMPVLQGTHCAAHFLWIMQRLPLRFFFSAFGSSHFVSCQDKPMTHNGQFYFWNKGKQVKNKNFLGAHLQISESVTFTEHPLVEKQSLLFITHPTWKINRQ